MNLIIFGDGGHSKVIQSIALENEIKIIAILDDKYKNSKGLFKGIYRGSLDDIHGIFKEGYYLFIAIGDNKVRKKLYNNLKYDSTCYCNIIHRTAYINKSVYLGVGNVIMPRVVINANVKLGNHCIINSGAIVEHDNIIADYVHISPNATLTGGVHIEEGTQIGAASVIIPRIKVGSWTIVGAGSTVINDLPSYVTAVGAPAKPIKFHE